METSTAPSVRPPTCFTASRTSTTTWVPVQRYMGIFHEVQPADNSLRCLDCHGPDGRLDWTGLGYEVDPWRRS